MFNIEKAENKSDVPWWIKRNDVQIKKERNDVTATQQNIIWPLKRTPWKTHARISSWKETLGSINSNDLGVVSLGQILTCPWSINAKVLKGKQVLILSGGKKNVTCLFLECGGRVWSLKNLGKTFSYPNTCWVLWKC